MTPNNLEEKNIPSPIFNETSTSFENPIAILNDNKKKSPFQRAKEGQSVVRIIFAYMKNYKKLLFFAFISVIFTIAFNMASVITLMYVTSFTTLTSQGEFTTFVTILGIWYLLYAIFTYIQRILLIRLGEKISHEIRYDLFTKLQKLKMSFFDTRSSGDLISISTNDTMNITFVLSFTLSDLITGFLTIFGSMITMFLISATLAAIVLVTVPTFLIVVFFIVKKTQPFFQKRQEYLGETNGFVEEMFSGQNLTNLFNQQEKISKQFNEKNKELVNVSYKGEKISSFVMPWSIFMINFIILLISIIGGVFALMDNPPFASVIMGGTTASITQNIAIITIFTILTRQVISPISNLLSLTSMFQMGFSSAKRIFSIYKEENEDLENENDLLEDVQGNISIENLNFSYSKNKRILKDVSFEITKNQSIAIVGPTGSGKSTIINLLTKFYNISEGKILFDGKDIANVKKESVRDNIAIVLQNPFIFNTSVKDNIRLGNLNATDEEIYAAAKLTRCDFFISQLENGYDTILHNNGDSLSVGQKQLISIARAIIDPAKILILDEATSNVDTKTEIDIQLALNELMKRKTSIIIAHRLSTIVNSDLIIVLKNGRIIEKGNHDSLLKNEDGFYSKMFNSQFEDEIENI